MMKKKIERNVFDRTGFLWQAWVHNCTNIDANSCTHIKGNDGLTKNIGTPNFC
jgi:tyrosinase